MPIDTFDARRTSTAKQGQPMDSQTISLLNNIMQWLVAPACAFIWVLYQRQQAHTTDIAVLKARVDEAKTAHDREIKEIRETSRAIMDKLNSIEEALRK